MQHVSKFAILLLPMVLATGACALEAEPDAEDGTEDANLSNTPVLGRIAYGEPKTFNHPGSGAVMRAVTFQGTAADDVTIQLDAEKEDTRIVAYVRGPDQAILARVGASGTPAAGPHVKLTAKLAKTGLHTIFFQDAKRRARRVKITANRVVQTCEVPRRHLRFPIPATDTCDVHEFSNLVSTNNLFIQIEPSATGCDHELSFVTSAGQSYGSLHVQQLGGDKISAFGSIGLPGGSKILACSGLFGDHVLEMSCPGSPRSCSFSDVY